MPPGAGVDASPSWVLLWQGHPGSRGPLRGALAGPWLRRSPARGNPQDVGILRSPICWRHIA